MSAFKADRIAAEQNFGGDVVRAVLHTVDRNVPVNLVNRSPRRPMPGEAMIEFYRLRAREATHFGVDAVGPGGWRHEETEAFIAWASHYEDGSQQGRSLAKHEAWLAGLPCPVLRLDGSRPLSELVAEVRRAIDG